MGLISLFNMKRKGFTLIELLISLLSLVF
ncbi:MAG: hypothetical protein COU40_03685 [Candidatus Moranbacteria bacterium CG10_big_fil_rev_8_21_14_0_10_35_21]|nr:MAG: hypothetical protein COU40_03685 [Candidatus Moranbacteria bacterium CG10_big_fil_rev_8_21_14_0_10_35_21]PJA88794.1 MAG: hypothetical protein CO139_01320 [Candidatus Moranbacteria bacterium CG_4_9_14_3_um_filter_36_9]